MRPVAVCTLVLSLPAALWMAIPLPWWLTPFEVHCKVLKSAVLQRHSKFVDSGLHIGGHQISAGVKSDQECPSPGDASSFCWAGAHP